MYTRMSSAKMTGGPHHMTDRNVVRGFGLVPRQNCATLKGRTTVVSEVWAVRFPGTFQVLAIAV